MSALYRRDKRKRTVGGMIMHTFLNWSEEKA